MGRQMIVNMIAFGLTCGFCGLKSNDWHFWVVLVGLLVVQINNFIPERN